MVQGGSLRGARYADVNVSDIRKAARSYRGDARFAQFCKQFVAWETVAAPCQPEGAPRPHSKISFSLACGSFLSRLWKALVEHCRGRWLTFAVMVCLLVLVITRPAFGHLCGRALGLSVRLLLRRSLGVLLAIIDSILDEAASQVEQALLPVPGLPAHPEPVHMTYQLQTWPSFAMHVLCLLIGSLLGRTLPQRGNLFVRHPPDPPP